MQGSAILLLSLLSITAMTDIRIPIENIRLQRAFEFEDYLLEIEPKNNCGYLHQKTLSLKNEDSFKHHEDYEKMTEVFGEDKNLSDCRAIVSGQEIWVRIVAIKDNKKCKLYVPYNAINLFNEDSEEYPHVNQDMFETTFGSYTKCEDIEEEKEENNPKKLTEAETAVLTSNYINFNLTPIEIENNIDLSDSDKEALIHEIIQEPTMHKVVKDIKGLSEEGQEALEEYVIEQIPENKISQALENPLFKTEVRKVKEAHPELDDKEPYGLDELFAEHQEEKAPVDENFRYLQPAQINELAAYCNESQIRRVVGLYKALATNGQLKTVQIWEQNVVECISGHDNRQFKAVLKFNDTSCLFDVVLDVNVHSATLMESPAIELMPCQKKPLFK